MGREILGNPQFSSAAKTVTGLLISIIRNTESSKGSLDHSPVYPSPMEIKTNA
jgi:hypothetical protein